MERQRGSRIIIASAFAGWRLWRMKTASARLGLSFPRCVLNLLKKSSLARSECIVPSFITHLSV